MSTARVRFALALMPHGSVTVDPAPSDSELADEELARALTAHLARDEAGALLDLGTRHPDTALPSSVAYFRDLARGFVAASAASAASPNAPAALPEAPSDLAARVEQAPPLRGHEYLAESTLDALWQRLGRRGANTKR